MARAQSSTEQQGTFTLVNLYGITIRIHWSWLLIVGLLTLGFWGQLTTEHDGLSSGSGLALAVFGSAVFFGSVLVHELAHAFVARARGIEVKGITLYLFGGATEADASSKSAIDEFIVAIVGPLTSLAVGILLLGGAELVGPGQEALADLIGYLGLVNLILAVFNMTPGLPLDGGRVFRSIVWGITGDFRRATRWAAGAGVIVGYSLIGFGLLSLWQGWLGGLWLAAIGWMISQSARRTEQQEELREVFKDLVAGDVMTSPVVTIPAECRVAETVRHYFAREDQTVFPVVEQGRIVGMLSFGAVRHLDSKQRATTTAGLLARDMKPALIAGSTTPMQEVIEALASYGPKGRVLVVDDGVLLGIVAPSDIIRRSSLADLLESPTTDA